MPVTYRFNLEADRSDGTKVLVQQSAAVYNTVEEALLQAGADAHMGAAPTPVDVIDGAHHGYEVTAHGEPVDGTGYYDKAVPPEELETRRKAAAKFKPKVLADEATIGRAATVVREHLLVHPDDVRPDVEDVAPMGLRKAVVKKGDKTIADATKRGGEELLAELRALVP